LLPPSDKASEQVRHSSLGDLRQWTQPFQRACVWERFTGTSKQIALDPLHAHLPDKVEHLDVLNAFGNHIGSGLTGNRRNAGQDTTRRLISEPLSHHRPIDFHSYRGIPPVSIHGTGG